ncbi:MAG: hypothetical protein IPM25_02145 [Chloracidobacterium sp.]|nr:hypothetical protein [Chloracidobacterium sp.]
MYSGISKYEVTPRDLARGRNLKIAAVTAPFAATAVPAVLFTVLAFLFGGSPPAAFTILVFGAIFTAIGFFIGIFLTGLFLYRRSNWTKEMREKIAADGIRAEEIDWFRHELKASERKALKEITRRDLLLADAYRETLASRLTATRIIRSSKRELSMLQRRKVKISRLKSERAGDFRRQIEEDREKIENIHEEARLMLTEAEARLEMIEAAGVRGHTLADSELALKKLSARSQHLPLALEEVRLAEEISRQLDDEAFAEEAGKPEAEAIRAKPEQDHGE